jgi:hypothetical protein
MVDGEQFCTGTVMPLRRRRRTPPEPFQKTAIRFDKCIVQAVAEQCERSTLLTVIDSAVSQRWQQQSSALGVAKPDHAGRV